MDLKEQKQQAKYQKKDILFSGVLGVCKVDEVTRLSTQGGENILYYGLRSIADQTKVSYVPVDNHSVLLRDLVTVEEAKKVLERAQLQKDKMHTAELQNEQVEQPADQNSQEEALLIWEAEYVIRHFDK